MSVAAEAGGSAELSVSAEDCLAFRERGGVVDLASRVKLLFKGSDRIRFLNGQLTANIAAAKCPSVIPACVTTAKGRLCADVLVSIGPSGVLVDADPAVAATLPARMERYIIADDVTMEDATESIAIVHFAGVKMDDVPEGIRAALVPSNRFGVAGHDYFSPFRKDLPSVWEKITAGVTVLSDALLELIRIEHGVPRWGRELDENTLPHEAGLDRTHIDFHKGCYIGQEVISRLRSVGHVNRELRGFVSADGTPLAVGARIFSAQDPARDLGRLTSAAFSFALDRHIALGYLRRDAAGGEFLATAPEAPDAPARIAVHPLPFIP
ncbi:MAG: glycine cleavage T C-terminal barrel domain-containing protein [Chthoniobacteraceae bacterium]